MAPPPPYQPHQSPPHGGEPPTKRLTAVIVIATAIAVVLVGTFFAVRNLTQLSQVSSADEGTPTAETTPPASAGADTASQQPTPTAPATPTPTPTPTASATALISISGAQSLDPFGDNNEHPELASNLVDGDPGTEWYSRFYISPTMDSRRGIGVAVTLASPARVSAVELYGTGSGGHVQIRATSSADPEGGTLLAEGSFASGTTTFTFTPTETGSIVVWVTELPRSSDGLNKATISEITLR